jgi:hypothetical protein
VSIIGWYLWMYMILMEQFIMENLTEI